MKTLFERLSDEHQQKITGLEKNCPDFTEIVMESLQKHYFTDLTVGEVAHIIMALNISFQDILRIF